MAGQSHRNSNVGGCILLLIAFFQVWSNRFAYASRSSPKKTMQSNDGDVIHCLDIYKQPAFDHPLLKNHTLQTRPSSSPRIVEPRNSTNTFQSWLKNEDCPEGTIPVSRTQIFNHRRVVPPIPEKFKEFDFTTSNHEYATVSIAGGIYHGAAASFNVWVPKVTDPGEFSISQLWIVSGSGDKLSSMEAGLQVLAGSSDETRFFIYWTADGYQRTGCYNLDCPGFVQVSRKFTPGLAVKPVSTCGGQQFEININIHKDTVSGNWWLTLQGEEVGYFPGNIFTSLRESSDLISFGGEIVNNHFEGHHTGTQMGSGHFPDEGFGKAAYIGHVSYIDASNVLRDAGDLITYASKPACYDLAVAKNRQGSERVHFFFGGPGFSAQCK